MSKNLYDEAIAEAKLLRETAEQNAKNAIIEAVTPRIRKFIEEQLLENKGSASDESDVLEDVISDMLHEGSGSDGSGENVALDETALSELVALLGGDSNSDSDDQIKGAVLESFNSLSTKDRKNLSTVANKLKQNANFLHSSHINNDVYVQQENSRMPRSEDILYEVNLEELASELGEMQMDDGHHQEMEEDMELEGSDDGFIDDMLSEIDDDDTDETVELEEVLKSLGLEGLLNEDKIEIDLGDIELPEDAMLTATRIADEEEDLDLEDVEAAEEDLGDEDVELDDEDFGDEPEDLQEVFDIDPRVLRSELKRLRLKIREAKDLTSIKGIKDAKESHFGGSGSGKAGLKGAYGGTGGSKAGVDGSYGGGKGSGDPLKVKLNKLSEAIKNERRRNRSLEGKLNEYRSAVETLREQLTDLNLFNAKLLYVNKLLQNKDVTSSQKRSVVESIDKANSLREVKLVYKTLTESFNKGKAGNLRESNVRRTLGSSSRATSRASAETANAEMTRWATLAGIKE